VTDYDYQKDWLLLKAKRLVPPEIVDFIESTFQVMEIRERLATVKGIQFEVRSREQNHNLPHIHASYDKYSISIAISTCEVLAGNLPKSQQRIAVDWVRSHTEDLLGKWNQIAISATSKTTKSRMG
jgi:hypothetical protein